MRRRLAPAACTLLAVGLVALPAPTDARHGARGGESPVVGAVPPPADATVYEVSLRSGAHDYFLPSPELRKVWLSLDARRAAPKTRVMFRGPIAGGPLRLHIDVRNGSPDHTYVVAVPLGPGQSVVVVSITGRGRFDLGFFADGPEAVPKEYRFTRRGPLDPTPFEVQISGGKG